MNPYTDGELEPEGIINRLFRSPCHFFKYGLFICPFKLQFVKAVVFIYVIGVSFYKFGATG
ncbi:MAG: hypothetical protein HND50_22265 [Calditrichaeota bacterium]|nr:hypothetical protein [Calditrichota bacterium]